MIFDGKPTPLITAADILALVEARTREDQFLELKHHPYPSTDSGKCEMAESPDAGRLRAGLADKAGRWRLDRLHNQGHPNQGRLFDDRGRPAFTGSGASSHDWIGTENHVEHRACQDAAGPRQIIPKPCAPRCQRTRMPFVVGRYFVRIVTREAR